MSTIRKTEDGSILVDDKPFNLETARQLSDDELADITGGIKIYVEHHWYGDTYIKCPHCGSSDFEIVGATPPNRLSIRCTKCGYYNGAEIKS